MDDDLTDIKSYKNTSELIADSDLLGLLSDNPIPDAQILGLFLTPKNIS